MKAAPLLRAWLHRLREAVSISRRHRCGWGSAGPCAAGPLGERAFRADAIVLALGGNSWARLGSDGAWWRSCGSAACP
jgi:predicted flavoprotein YhiN